MAREAIDVCFLMLKESNNGRFDCYRVKNSVLIISQITVRDCREHIFLLTFLEIAVYYFNTYLPPLKISLITSDYAFFPIHFRGCKDV